MAKSSRVDLSWRAAADELGAWTAASSARTVREALDEVESWRGQRLHHGDLVAVSSAARRRLFVFDSARSSLAQVPDPPPPRRPLIEVWGPAARADLMLDWCPLVDPWRVCAAACELAEHVLHIADEVDGRPRAAVAAARAAFLGSAQARPVAPSADGAMAAAQAARARIAVYYAALAAAEAAYCAMYACIPARRYIGDAVSASARSAAHHASRAVEHSGGAGAVEWLQSQQGVVRSWVTLSHAACAAVGAADPDRLVRRGSPA